MPIGAVQPDIHALIETKDFASLKSALKDMEIHDLVSLLAQLEDEDLAVCFRLLPQERAGEVFGDLPIERQEELLSTLSTERVATILNGMPPDERTELLEELPGELAQRLVNSLRGEQLAIARSLLAYPEDSVGRLMTPNYVAVRPDWTVQQVLEHIRQTGATRETFNVLYVVDDRWKLLDEIRLEQVILAEPNTKVRELMDEQVASLAASEDKEAAIETFKKYDAVALPVVNRQGVLVGIVTVDDVMDVVEEEHTEDLQKMVAVEPLETSYFSTGLAGMLQKRLPWLILLLMAQMLTTLALARFNALPLFAALVIFMPLINSPAGNTGTQMAGLMIRSLALQETALEDWRRVLGRELLGGLAMGLALAVLGFAAVFAFGQMLHEPLGQPLRPALAVALSIASAVTVANVTGAMLPFLFKRIGLDPAVTSGPFIAWMMDVAGILVYFSIASVLVSVLA